MVYTYLCSFYFSVFDEHAVDMTLKEFVELLRGERWKAQVEEYQRLKASGRETEAKKLKRKLAALVIAGRCEGSHAETNLKQWSGDAMLDVDSVFKTKTELFRKVFGVKPVLKQKRGL